MASLGLYCSAMPLYAALCLYEKYYVGESAAEVALESLMLTGQSRQLDKLSDTLEQPQERYVRMHGLSEGDQQYHLMGLYEAMEGEGLNVWRLIRSQEVRQEKATIIRRYKPRVSSGGSETASMDNCMTYDIKFEHHQKDGVMKETKVPRDRICIRANENVNTSTICKTMDLRLSKLKVGTAVEIAVPIHTEDTFLYRSNTGQWCVSDHEDMELRHSTGWLCVTSDALSPVTSAAASDEGTRTKTQQIWRVWHGGGNWPKDKRVECIVSAAPTTIRGRRDSEQIAHQIEAEAAQQAARKSAALREQAEQLKLKVQLVRARVDPVGI
jgi:hypothetical protein